MSWKELAWLSNDSDPSEIWSSFSFSEKRIAREWVKGPQSFWDNLIKSQIFCASSSYLPLPIPFLTATTPQRTNP